MSEALVKADQNDAAAKRGLSISYSRLGDVDLKLGAVDKALGWYQKAGLNLNEALLKADPSNMENRQDVSNVLSRLAKAQISQRIPPRLVSGTQSSWPWTGRPATGCRRRHRARREVAVDCENLHDLCADRRLAGRAELRQGRTRERGLHAESPEKKNPLNGTSRSPSAISAKPSSGSDRSRKRSKVSRKASRRLRNGQNCTTPSPGCCRRRGTIQPGTANERSSWPRKPAS